MGSWELCWLSAYLLTFSVMSASYVCFSWRKTRSLDCRWWLTRMHSRIRGTAPLGEHSSFIDLAVTFLAFWMDNIHTYFSLHYQVYGQLCLIILKDKKNFVENSCKQSYRHYVTFYLNTSYYYSKTTKFLLAIFCLFTVFDFSVIYMY